MLAEKIEPDKYGLVAVDNNSWTSSDQNAVFEVKKMDYRAAITQFKPQIIVASWIPVTVIMTLKPEVGIRKQIGLIIFVRLELKNIY